MSREIPILFTGPMVRAVMDGTKTETRRVITVPWHKGKRRAPYEPWYVEEDGKLLYQDEYGDYHPMEERCPYGVPGDRLWVRETFALADDLPLDAELNPGGVYYRATHSEYDDSIKWKPSIHMPRWASRTTLERTGDVRVERVQDISEEDFFAEGLRMPPEEECPPRMIDILGWWKTDWRKLWDSINLKRGYGWESNPWVWVVTFKRLD